MTKEKALELLEDRELDIEKVREIFEEFKDDNQIVGQVAMNLSLRTSVFDREKGKSDTMRYLLVQLSKSSDMGSRWAVAKNPHTPVEVLKELADDKVNLVRALVATNPNTPPEILRKLFNDEKIVKDGLSGNPSTPIDILEKFVEYPDRMARMRLAENSAATEKILKALLNDADHEVAKAAKVNLEKRGAE